MIKYLFSNALNKWPGDCTISFLFLFFFSFFICNQFPSAWAMPNQPVNAQLQGKKRGKKILNSTLRKKGEICGSFPIAISSKEKKANKINGFIWNAHMRCMKSEQHIWETFLLNCWMWYEMKLAKLVQRWICTDCLRKRSRAVECYPDIQPSSFETLSQ